MKTYYMHRDRLGGCVAYRDGVPLPPYHHVWNHSPTGFGWSYAGSGPAQLALALLCDATGDIELARELHQEFKSAVVAPETRDQWFITDEWIQGWASAAVRFKEEARHQARKGDAS